MYSRLSPMFTDYNYALSQYARQSNPLNGNPDYYAPKAVDGNLATYSQTPLAASHWWRLNMDKRIIFRKAAIYVRNDCSECGKCDTF